jgi:hypothetical protein
LEEGGVSVWKWACAVDGPQLGREFLSDLTY